MSGLRLALIGLVLISANGCGVGHYVELQCETCNGMESAEGFGCSLEEARQAAENICISMNGVVGSTVGSPRTEITPLCRHVDAPGDLQPIPETARFFKSSFTTAQRALTKPKSGAIEGCTVPDQILECDCDIPEQGVTLLSYSLFCSGNCSEMESTAADECQTLHGGTAIAFRCIEDPNTFCPIARMAPPDLEPTPDSTVPVR